MISTTKILLEKYNAFGDPFKQIKRLVSNGELTPIIKGLYETNRNVDGYLLAGAIMAHHTYRSTLLYPITA